MYSNAVVYKDATATNDSMLQVYSHMSLAVITSMIVSGLVGYNAYLLQLFFGTPLKWVIIFAPLAAVFAISFLMDKMTKSQAMLALHGFAALMGLSFATIFVVYSLGSITSAFFGASILFITMTVYGYFTKQSLDSFGKYLIVGLIAIIITSIVNIFIGSSMLATIVSAVAIVIFLGLTAYDTQRIREEIMYGSDDKTEIRGALSLYLNFINLFLSLLQLFGDKKE